MSSMVNVLTSRRDVLALGAAVAASMVLPARLAAAQEASPEASPEVGSGGPQVDPSFSNVILPTLGLQTIDLTVSPDGLSGAPAEVAGGKLLVNFTAADGLGYLLLAQPAAGLTLEEELAQAEAAGSGDEQQAGWVYGGGTYADPDQTVQVVVELDEGDWTIYASHQVPTEDQSSDEIYTATRITVTGNVVDAVASPASSPMLDLPVDVTAEMFDAAYVLSTDTIAAGPKVWAFPNVGETQAHHVVMMRTPELIESADIAALVDSFSTPDGMPPEWFMRITWVGYTALVSPGYVAYNEFDLDPGSYLMLCFILDTEMQMPHFAMGMWAAFTVTA